MMVRLLMWLTRRLPARAIRLDGRRYIERYHLGVVAGVTMYLHRYLGADADRHLHHHPWQWSLGIPLVGGYTEERLVRLCPRTGLRTRLRRVGHWWPNLITARTFHRVAAIEPGTWTLFVHAPRHASWGFLELVPPDEGGSGTGVLYRPAYGSLDTTERLSDWQRTAPTGADLRHREGTEGWIS